MINLDNFDWGWMNEPSNKYHVNSNGSYTDIGQYHKNSMIKEIFVDKCYEKIFEVEQNDIVVDVGASIGPWKIITILMNLKNLETYI